MLSRRAGSNQRIRRWLAVDLITAHRRRRVG